MQFQILELALQTVAVYNESCLLLKVHDRNVRKWLCNMKENDEWNTPQI